MHEEAKSFVPQVNIFGRVQRLHNTDYNDTVSRLNFAIQSNCITTSKGSSGFPPRRHRFTSAQSHAVGRFLPVFASSRETKGSGSSAFGSCAISRSTCACIVPRSKFSSASSYSLPSSVIIQHPAFRSISFWPKTSSGVARLAIRFIRSVHSGPLLK